MWFDERLSSGGKKSPKFGLDCMNGKIKLEPLRKLPEELFNLLIGTDDESNSFRSSIRMYNSALSFTSTYCYLERNLASNRNGVYTFRISGEFYHGIGSAIADDDNLPKFARIYIYDQEFQQNYRQIKIREKAFYKEAYYQHYKLYYIQLILMFYQMIYK
jgi:hypothetical protein